MEITSNTETPKTINEILVVVLNTYKTTCTNDKNYQFSGLCSVINQLVRVGYLELPETHEFLDYLQKNQPWRLSGKRYVRVNYFWPRNQAKPRIKWLKKHIKKTAK